jgi:hypothetical protein
MRPKLGSILAVSHGVVHHSVIQNSCFLYINRPILHKSFVSMLSINADSSRDSNTDPKGDIITTHYDSPLTTYLCNNKT